VAGGRTHNRDLDAGSASDHGPRFRPLLPDAADAADEDCIERAQGSCSATECRRCAGSAPGTGADRLGPHRNTMMRDIGTFLAMGGYAGFVWTAYGIGFAVLGGLAAFSWRRYRDSIVALERLQHPLTRKPCPANSRDWGCSLSAWRRSARRRP